MNINEVKELINAVSKSELTAFDYEEGNIRLSLRKGINDENPISQKVTAPKNAVEIKDVEEKQENTVIEEDKEVAGNIVKSPLVGTAYLAPEEGAEPFVKLGDTVKKGQTLAIVEAMKLMNEIESDFDGVVSKILIENAKAVEYGQPLFEIK